MKKRLLLVSPNDFATTYGDFRHIEHLTGNTGRLLTVSLPTLAALTPDEFEVRIIDENAEKVDFTERYDIVGITGFPPQLFRARELAEQFRARGTLVVCGGTSASLSPDKWRPIADVLIVGEAERTWPAFLADYLAGRHQAEYREAEKLDLALCPVPDYRGFSPRAIQRFAGGIVQTSRGCPFDCEFCDAIVFAGRKTRYKPIERIIDEIEQIVRLGLRYVYLADDNFGANRRKAKDILRALADWNARQPRPMPFLTQLTIDLAKEDEFLELAAKAGLTKVFIGLESPSVESLTETHKLQNVRTDMHEGVKRFQEHGIEVAGGCIVGFDHDDLSIFRRQVAFFTELGIPNVQVYPLNAPDGTPLKERMIREGRYLEWTTSENASSKFFSYFNSYTIAPKQMSIEQLQQGMYWLLWQLYDLDNFVERVRVYLEHYEASAEKDKLELPSWAARLGPSTFYKLLRHDKPGMMVVLRLLRYFVSAATPAERRALVKLVRYARASSHPQRWGIALSSFLTVLNTRAMLLAQAPGIETTTYPEGQPVVAARPRLDLPVVAS
jgi:radical SAM superfamily enzyme YgiQ (UPF0313 family)